MNVKTSGSGSDVSSDSSWTVIEEIEETITATKSPNAEPGQNLNIEVIKTTEVVKLSDVPQKKDDEFVKVTLSKSSLKESSDEECSRNETRENGFLTFDEYLQERMLEHDYEYPNQSVFKKKLSKSKRSSKNRSKCKAETIGVLSLCASLLTVTGIALLCIIFPENIDSKNFDTVKSNCQAISQNDSLDYNNIVASFNRTMEVLEATNSSKILEKSANAIAKKPEYRYKLPRKTMGPMNEVASRRLRLCRKSRNSFCAANIFKNDMCYPKSNNGVCYASENPSLTPSASKKRKDKSVELSKLIEQANAKITEANDSSGTSNQTTALSSIESVLAGTNLKKIIRSIIHDICILKLITYLNKNNEPQQTKKKSNKGEQKASKRKLYEAIADGIERIKLDENKDRRIRTARRKNKTRKSLKHKEGSADTILSATSTSRESPKQNFLLQYSRQSTSYPMKTDIIQKFENGKSECERRFEELDNHRKKSQEVCSKHKTNIQNIKQQFRNEIDAIKDSNIEPMIRLHRIQNLREKYRLQLKKNREIYMREMSKMKRMRARMLKDLCAQKRNDLEMKDAAVGNYVVPIEQDFYSRLQQLKDKEVMPYTFNSLSIQSCDKNEKTEPIFQLSNKCNNNFGVSTFRFSAPTSVVEKNNKNERNYIFQECGNSKRQCLKSTPSIPSVFGLSVDFDSKDDESNSLELNNVLDEDVFPKSNEVDSRLKKYSDDSEDVDTRCETDRQKIQGHMYQIAFERKGHVIENADNAKWHQKRAEQWEKYRKEICKQDPQKGYKPSMITYKY